MKRKSLQVFPLILVVFSLLLTACGSKGDYEAYAAAYRKLTEKGGLDADFDVTLEMDGTTTKSEGNFKRSTSDGKTALYYEMDIDGAKVTQFSDGEYLYTDTDGNKTKYALDSKPAASTDRKEVKQKDSGSVFNTEEFLNEFSGFLEAGKIRELGLLSPIDSAAVTKVTEENGVYTLSITDSLVKQYLNTMIENQTQSSNGETLKIDQMKDFTYKATVKNEVITNVEYSGIITVDVPGSLMESGNAESYELDFQIQISYVNPGEKVEVALPSTDGYKEL